jgi:hypothetical protein
MAVVDPEAAGRNGRAGQGSFEDFASGQVHGGSP